MLIYQKEKMINGYIVKKWEIEWKKWTRKSIEEEKRI